MALVPSYGADLVYRLAWMKLTGNVYVTGDDPAGANDGQARRTAPQVVSPFITAVTLYQQLVTKVCNDAQRDAALVSWLFCSDKREKIGEHSFNMHSQLLGIFGIKSGTTTAVPLSPTYLYYQLHL